MSENQAAFIALQELANKSWRHAQQLPAQVDTGSEWTGVGFSLLGLQFVVPMGQIAEILEIPGFTPLPNVKSWVKGVANIRGRLLPIFDMGEFFGGRLKNNKKVQRILALATDPANATEDTTEVNFVACFMRAGSRPFQSIGLSVAVWDSCGCMPIVPCNGATSTLVGGRMCHQINLSCVTYFQIIYFLYVLK